MGTSERISCIGDDANSLIPRRWNSRTQTPSNECSADASRHNPFMAGVSGFDKQLCFFHQPADLIVRVFGGFRRAVSRKEILSKLSASVLVVKELRVEETLTELADDRVRDFRYV